MDVGVILNDLSVKSIPSLSVPDLSETFGFSSSSLKLFQVRVVHLS